MISILVYSESRFALNDATPADLPALRTDPAALLWINLCEPTPEETRLVLEEVFAFHPLAVEDCVSDSPFPKVESYEDFHYIVLHVLTPGLKGEFAFSELDLFIGKGYLITYQRKPIAAVQSTYQRYARPGSPVVRGPDRFLHSLMEACVAAGEPTFERFRTSVEKVQTDVLANASATEIFEQVVKLRKAIARLKDIVRPQFAIANELGQGKHRFVRATIVPYFRDLAEALSHYQGETEGLAEQLILSFRIYLNKSSHEANAGIRILTGITALTFPTLLVGGWFGMNFERMDELHTPWGYAMALILVLVGTVATAVFMRRRKWL
ncbi:MAG: magnesium transporter CorA family protein [Opitutaceae bacterium]|nr:magnesium transporter CorA family protein [Opitutaceae bacterium]